MRAHTFTMSSYRSLSVFDEVAYILQT